MVNGKDRSLRFSRMLAFAITGVLCASFLLAVKSFAAQQRRTIEVPKEIVEQLMQDEELRKLIHLGENGRADNLVAEPVELNRDGKPELKVHGIGDICGAANCETWIFRKVGNKYQMLLDAGSIQRIELQKTFSHGYRDLIASMHGSACDSDLTLYKFDGQKYQRVTCFFRTYRYPDRRGQMREWKQAKISRRECESH